MNARKYLAALGAVLLASILCAALAVAQDGTPAAAPATDQKAACTHGAGQACTAACPHAAAEGCAKKCSHGEAEGCAKKCSAGEAEGGHAMMEKCAAMMQMCASGEGRMCLIIRTHDEGEGCVGMCLVGEGPACPKHRAAASCGGEGHCGGKSHCAGEAGEKACDKACDKAACPSAAAGACHKAPEPATK